MKQIEYTIGDKKYTQRKLVLGQILLLTQLLKNVNVLKDMTPSALIATIGMKMPDALAIVLIPDGTAIKEKASDDKRLELATEISFNIDAETTLQVVGDFFDCNPIAFLLEKLSGATEKIISQVKSISKPSSPSSPEETSPSESISSGALLQPSASLT